MFNWLREKFGSTEQMDIRERLRLEKKVKVAGVLFTIRKIDVMDYLEGLKVMHEIFSTYKTNPEKFKDEKLVNSLKKSREYMRDVIMAGVVKPKLVRKQEDDPKAVCVDELLVDLAMSQEVVKEIIAFTYGKKK